MKRLTLILTLCILGVFQGQTQEIEKPHYKTAIKTDLILTGFKIFNVVVDREISDTKVLEFRIGGRIKRDPIEVPIFNATARLKKFIFGYKSMKGIYVAPGVSVIFIENRRSGNALRGIAYGDIGFQFPISDIITIDTYIGMGLTADNKEEENVILDAYAPFAIRLGLSTGYQF